MCDVLLASAQGYGNIGDDAIRDTILQELYKNFTNLNVKVTHPKPEKELIENSKIVVVGGGGLIYDVVPTNVEYYTQYLEWAQELGKPNALFNIGVQHDSISTDYGKERYREVLSKVDLLTVRDFWSVYKLRSIGVKGEIFISTDIAILLEPSPVSFKVDNPTIGLCISNFPEAIDNGRPAKRILDDFLNSHLFSILESLVREYNFIVIPFGSEERELNKTNLKFIEKLKATFIDYSEGYKPSHILDIFNNLDFVITSRLHPLVFSTNVKKPCGIHSRGGKLTHFADSLGYPRDLYLTDDWDIESNLRYIISKKYIGNIISSAKEPLITLAREDMNRLIAFVGANL